MALIAGTVTIGSDGAASGTGLALAIAQAKLDAFEASLPDNAAALSAVYSSIAADSQATATAIVSYLVANAVPIVGGNSGTLT